MDPASADAVLLQSFGNAPPRGFAEAIDADVLDFRFATHGRLDGTITGDAINAIRYPDYDIYLIEGSSPLYAGVIRRLIDDDAKLIYLGFDRGMFNLNPASASIPRPASASIPRGSPLTKFLETWGAPIVRMMGKRYIDGVIANSDLIADYARNIVGPDTPISVVHSYIKQNTYERVLDVEPALEENIAVTVGRGGAWAKGIDLLVDAWKTVRESHPDAELHLVGTGYPDKYGSVPGVKILGYFDDISLALEPASLYVQPSRIDAFPVAVLEAMCAGLPPLVTQLTGARSESRAIDGSLVVDVSRKNIAQGIIQYFDSPIKYRMKLSKVAINRGSDFHPENQKHLFVEEYSNIIDHV